MSTRSHWEQTYATKAEHQVSWYRPHLEVSLELLTKAGLNQQSRIIDIGGGASTLVDDLLDRGTSQITVVDLSATALEISRKRLGQRAAQVNWIVQDVARLELARDSIDIWHDRAALHFLVAEDDIHRYVQVATHAIAPGGHAVIGGFAADGPEKCSGLPVVRRDPEEIAALFGDRFSLIESRRELHTTPAGKPQSFAYALLRKTS
jgi:ubiquinone/menaquinone biosynthesis C-methylase UbiE